ncbi:hypothetical protein EST38_g6471 [Candolleomyces aberdarensis]|uniref:G domain-containing protein n=1 Tax=Candolleomyces aberdarensis TaxID=2316362 RepID=A0A4Q2DHR0_9AGAR|nr:hypothetical protein EST38_g6471 [Candolleomyces aberdarensis]
MKNDELWEKAKRCWDIFPENRPPISEFTAFLQQCLPRNSGTTGASSDDEWDGTITSKIRSKTFDIVEQTESPRNYDIAPVGGDPGITESMKMFKPHAGSPPPMDARLGGSVARRLDKSSVIQESDVIILVLGAPLSGKSTFINNYFSNPRLAPVHHQLFPPSHEMAGYFQLPDTNRIVGDGRNIVLVDTPGLFSWKSNDLGIVKDIVDLLLKGHDHEKTIRILYLHDISSPRMSVDVLMSLSFLKALCGKIGGNYNESTDSSFVGPLPPRGFEEREGHLRTVYWKECLEGGAHYWRVQGRWHERALVEEIIESVLDTGSQQTGHTDDPARFGFAIQKEMQQDRLAFPNTETGKAMKSCLVKALEEEIKSGGDKERIEALKRQHKELTKTAQPKRRFARKP